MTRRRLPVDVDALFTVDGDVLPRALRLYKNHEWLPVVKIHSVQKAANRRVGGAGLKYDCDVLMGVVDGAPVQRRAALWRELDNFLLKSRWRRAHADEKALQGGGP